MGRKLRGKSSLQRGGAGSSGIVRAVGPVESVTVMRDMATGRARGFGFVEMATDEGAQKAITELHESQLGGRTLTVNEARPKEAARSRRRWRLRRQPRRRWRLRRQPWRRRWRRRTPGAPLVTAGQR